MRTIFFVLIGLLAGCNQSDNDSAFATQQQVSAIPNESTSVAALRAEVQALQTQVKQIQLIGRPANAPTAKTDAVRTMAMFGEPTFAPSAVTVVGQFGICPNMGIQDGFNTAIGDALAAGSKAFKTCTGYHIEYTTNGGNIKQAPRIFWDGPNCTGNQLEWEAGGAGYDTETLQDGVVFADPSNSTSVLMVSAHQTPQPILIQSVFVLANPGCQTDVEVQKMYSVSINSTQITGVPNIAIGQFTTGSP